MVSNGKQSQHASKTNPGGTQQMLLELLECCPSRGWLTKDGSPVEARDRIQLIRPLLFFNLFGVQLLPESVLRYLQCLKSTNCIFFKTGVQLSNKSVPQLPPECIDIILNPDILRVIFAQPNQCKGTVKRRQYFNFCVCPHSTLSE